jgi:hypothetical protein
MNSKKPNLTKDLYTRIPEAVTALGGVAHGEAVKIWILESDNATKATYGRTVSNKKFPNGRWCFDCSYTSAQLKLKKEKILFSPAYLYLSTSKTARVENPLSWQKWSQQNGVDSNGNKYEAVELEKPKKPKKPRVRKPKVKSEPVEVIEETVVEVVKEMTENVGVVEPEVEPEEIISETVEVEPEVEPEEIISETVEVEPEVEPEEIISETVEPEVEPEKEIISETVEVEPEVVSVAKDPVKIEVEQHKENIWDDIFDEDFTYGVTELPKSKFYACVEEDSYIISLNEEGLEAIEFNMAGNPKLLQKENTRKMYKKLKSKDLKILDNFISKLLNHLDIDVSIRRNIVPNQENPIIFMFKKVGMNPFITEI